MNGTEQYYPSANNHYGKLGVNIRTEIAVRCLQGLLSNPELNKVPNKELAKRATETADSLIQALNEKIGYLHPLPEI